MDTKRPVAGHLPFPGFYRAFRRACCKAHGCALLLRLPRLAAWLLMAELLALAPAAIAESGVSAAAGGQRAAARIDLLVRIPEVLSLRLLGEPSPLEVTPEDVARGFVVAPVSMEVRSNARSGFQLQLRTDPRLATDGVVEGLDAPVPLTGADASIRLSHHGSAEKTRRYALRVRLSLPPGTQPGRYAQPVQLSLSA